MRYPTWLKRLFLPFEFEDHPLYYRAPEPEEWTDEEWEEIWGPAAGPLIQHRPPD